MKVYVLTIGIYSDYRIIGVFTSREKAVEFCPALESGLDDGSKPGLEEYDTDPTKPQEKFWQETWRVYLNLSDGSLNMEAHEPEERGRDYSYSSVCPTVSSYKAQRDQLVLGESVVSRDHALKLAAECRQAYLRDKALPCV